MRAGRRLRIAICFVGALAACGGASDDGTAEARTACSTAVPAIAAVSSTWGETLDACTEAASHSSQAADKDKRWDGLNYAIHTLVSAWTDAVEMGGRDATDTSIPAEKKAAVLT